MTGNMPSIQQLLGLLGQFVSNQGAGSLVSPQVAQQVATSPATSVAPGANAPVPAPGQSAQQSLQQALAGQLYQPTQGGQPQPASQFVEPPSAQQTPGQMVQQDLPHVKEFQDPSGYVLTGGHADPSAPSGWAFDRGYHAGSWGDPNTPTGGDPAPGTSSVLTQSNPQQQTPTTTPSGGGKQPWWQQTQAPPPALGGTVSGGGNVITAPAPGTGQVIGQQFPGSRTVATAKPPPGMVQQGNIDLYNRPQVKNPDGTVSTVRSMSIDIGGKSYLIPTVAKDGSGVLTDQEAVDQFRQTGQHLGVFDNHQDADAYAQQLHKQQDQLYTPNLQGGQQ